MGSLTHRGDPSPISGGPLPHKRTPSPTAGSTLTSPPPPSGAAAPHTCGADRGGAALVGAELGGGEQRGDPNESLQCAGGGVPKMGGGRGVPEIAGGDKILEMEGGGGEALFLGRSQNGEGVGAK